MVGKNNVENNRYKLAMQTLLNQAYQNYRVIIIDDASTDGTPDRIQQFINSNAPDPTKFTLVRNNDSKLALENLYVISKDYCK